MPLLWTDNKLNTSNKEEFFLSQNIKDKKFIRISDSFGTFYHPYYEMNYFCLGGDLNYYGSIERFDNFFLEDSLNFLKSFKDKNLIITSFITKIKDHLALINKDKHIIYLNYISDNDKINKTLTGATFSEQYKLFQKLKKESYNVFLVRLEFSGIIYPDIHSQKNYSSFSVSLCLRSRAYLNLKNKIKDLKIDEKNNLYQDLKLKFIKDYKLDRLSYEDLSHHYYQDGLDTVSSLFDIIWQDNASDRLVQEFTEMISQNTKPPNEIPDYMIKYISKQQNLLYKVISDKRFKFEDFYKIENYKRSDRNSSFEERYIFKNLSLFLSNKKNNLIDPIVGLFIKNDKYLNEFEFYLNVKRLHSGKAILRKKINERKFIEILKN